MISLIHTFILKKQQISGSHNYKANAIFEKAHSKMIKSTFKFPEFVLPCKTSVYSICSVLRCSQFYSPMTGLATPILDHAHPINFWSAFNFCESLSTCKNSVYCIYLFFKYSHLQLKSILESHHMTSHTHFSPCQLLKYSITF